MLSRSKAATTFDVDRAIQPIYSGGDVCLDQDGRTLATCLGEETLLTDAISGAFLGRVEGVSLIAFL